MPGIAFNSPISISLRWAAFKALCASKLAPMQFVDLGDVYQLFAIDGQITYTCELTKTAASALGCFDEVYTQEDNDADVTEFETSHLATCNVALTTRDGAGLSLSGLVKPTTGKVTLYSHDWSDPTTWYEAAVRVVAEIATCDNPLLHTVYSVAHADLIDTYHGKITQEDFLRDANGHSYRVAVTVDDVAKTECDPHVGSGGDYTVDYRAGKITFTSGQGSGVVKVTNNYAKGSLFTIKPAAGKKLLLDFVEVQFGADIELTDSAVFQAYGYVDVFAPQYLQANGGPYPSGTKIPLGNPVVYKTMRDYMNDAVRSYVQYPAMGGAAWRGIQQPVYVFDWDYLRSTALSSAAGMELRITLAHEVPFGGSYATATFYCATETEA